MLTDFVCPEPLDNRVSDFFPSWFGDEHIMPAICERVNGSWYFLGNGIPHLGRHQPIFLGNQVQDRAGDTARVYLHLTKGNSPRCSPAFWYL